MIRVMIVDDEHHFMNELCDILSSRDDVEVCGRYFNGFAAFAALEKEKPDLVLTDMLMPGITGLELAVRVTGTRLSPQVVLMSENPSYAADAYAAGLAGFILKPLVKARVTDCD